MPFGLKNAKGTCQRMMNKVFANQIERNIEVYIDDILVKFTQQLWHDLKEMFKTLQKYNMRLN